MRRLIVGCGYLGLRVARLWQQAGDTVLATTRGSRAAALAAEGLTPVPFDVLAADSGPLPEADTVLVATARDGLVDPFQLYDAGLGVILDRLAPGPARLLHISSTGVYGVEDGRWVDELTPTVPDRPASAALLAAEERLRRHTRGGAATVLRLAGLYGGERLPLRRDIVAGRVLAGRPDAWMNFLHVEDAARAVVAAAERPDTAGLVINVADGTPVTRRAFVAAVAAHEGVAAPGFTGEGGTGKRVQVRRMRERLGLVPQYPSVLEALGTARSR